MAVAVLLVIDDSLVQVWNTLPSKLPIPGTNDHVHGAQVGWNNGTYRLVDYVVVDNPPSAMHEKVSESVDVTGNTYTVTYNYSPPVDNAANRAKYALLIDAEKRRRLRLGGNVTVSGGTLALQLKTDFDFSVLVGLAVVSDTGDILYADTGDNVFSLTPSDRQTVADAAINRERYLEVKAYQLRQLGTMATDYDDDSYWTNGS